VDQRPQGFRSPITLSPRADPDRRWQSWRGSFDVESTKANARNRHTRGELSRTSFFEEISTSFTIPVPGSLVGQIAKLRGARFLVDDNGAIIISGEGSNRADVVIDPQ
jgi:hypothetical protein